MPPAFQDVIPDNRCWGCGNLNDGGLQIKSRRAEKGGDAIATWQPLPLHIAGPPDVLNGGVIATLIDCHSVCSAIARAYRGEGREIGDGEPIWFATGSLSNRYKKPTPIDARVTLRARVESVAGRRTILSYSLSSGDVERASAEIAAIRVAPSWTSG